jgi:uncharacterized phage-associated protein
MSRAHTDPIIGNVLAYMAERIPDLSLTKALKLLFILDREAILATGVPVTWLKYQAWRQGPVAREVYKDAVFHEHVCLRGKEYTIRNYVQVDTKLVRGEVKRYLRPKEGYKSSLRRLSPEQKQILELVLNTYGDKLAKTLVDHLHKPDSLWEQVVARNQISFREGYGASDYPVDLSELNRGKPIWEEIYQDAEEALAESRS